MVLIYLQPPPVRPESLGDKCARLRSVKHDFMYFDNEVAGLEHEPVLAEMQGIPLDEKAHAAALIQARLDLECVSEDYLALHREVHAALHAASEPSG